MIEFNYKPKSIQNLKNDFNRRRRMDINDFNNFEEFIQWYNSMDKTCSFCGISEMECQEIVVKGLLTSNRFPDNGIVKRGRARGMWLEVDRLKPKENYSKQNCVLCCYFCNNDKSDVFHGEDYRKFQNNRVGFLRKLLKDNN